MSADRPTSQTAVWYFVAATFIFVAPLLFFRDFGLPWLPLVTLPVGLAVVVAGAVVFTREIRSGRGSGRAGDDPG